MLIRALTAPDVPAVRQIIEEWLTDPESGILLASEVAHRVGLIQEAVATLVEPWYFVAEDPEDAILGVIGLKADHIATELYSRSETPVEIVTAYVRRASRGEGVGRALTETVEQVARQRGFSTLLVVSGSRNRESGYPFWQARYGDPMRVDQDYFGPGAERVVWRSQLRP
jgi:GNAT superfamily N-acetyltransferase